MVFAHNDDGLIVDRNIEKPCYRIGCTGHIDLSRIADFDMEKTKAELRAYFAEISARYKIVLYCGLADGADMLFAEQAANCGGDIVAVLPCSADEFKAEHADGGAQLMRFINSAAKVVVAPDSEQRYVGVSKYIISHSAELVALWDGRELPLTDENGKPINRGGTYDTILSAKNVGITVKIFN